MDVGMHQLTLLTYEDVERIVPVSDLEGNILTLRASDPVVEVQFTNGSLAYYDVSFKTPSELNDDDIAYMREYLGMFVKDIINNELMSKNKAVIDRLRARLLRQLMDTDEIKGEWLWKKNA